MSQACDLSFGTFIEALKKQRRVTKPQERVLYYAFSKGFESGEQWQSITLENLKSQGLQSQDDSLAGG